MIAMKGKCLMSAGPEFPPLIRFAADKLVFVVPQMAELSRLSGPLLASLLAPMAAVMFFEETKQ